MTIQDEKLSNAEVIDRIKEILHDTMERSPHIVAGICELIKSTRDPSVPLKDKKKRSKTYLRERKKEKKSSKTDSESSIKQGKRHSLNVDEGKKEETAEEDIVSVNRPEQENVNANRPEEENVSADQLEGPSESQVGVYSKINVYTISKFVIFIKCK